MGCAFENQECFGGSRNQRVDEVEQDNNRRQGVVLNPCGTLCSGDLSPMQATYTLAENKIKHTPALERDEMLQLLADKYFRSHPPATFEDFVRWSEMSVSDCQKAVSLLGNEPCLKEQYHTFDTLKAEIKKPR